MSGLVAYRRFCTDGFKHGRTIDVRPGRLPEALDGKALHGRPQDADWAAYAGGLLEMSEARPSLAYLVGRVSQGVRREMRVRLTPLGLSVPEFTVLSLLGGQPGLSNAQLARQAMVAPQSMIEILSELERRGAVRRSADHHHRRILLSELTEDGKRLLHAAEPGVLALEDQLLDGLAESERARVLDALLTAMRRLSERA